MAKNDQSNAFFKARAEDAKRLSDFMSGKSNVHPHGASGMMCIIPRQATKNCWDTDPRAWYFSEWGNNAGMVPDVPKR
jgi:hypothetical protein